MNSRRNMVVAFVLLAALACTAAIAQTPTQPAPAAAPTPPAAPSTYMLQQFGGFGSSKDQAQATKLAKQYAKAEKEDEKKEIRKKLSDVLATQFDQHVKQQQKELEDLEKQIASVRTTLKKRADAKTSIVDRRAEQLILEAEGMGWSIPSTPRAGLGGAGALPLLNVIRQEEDPFFRPQR
jgi:flagellar motility protein MotE (MotC chaperone)